MPDSGATGAEAMLLLLLVDGAATPVVRNARAVCPRFAASSPSPAWAVGIVDGGGVGTRDAGRRVVRRGIMPAAASSAWTGRAPGSPAAPAGSLRISHASTSSMPGGSEHTLDAGGGSSLICFIRIVM